MKQTISKSDFRDAFQRCGRGNQFSYDGLGALFDYFEEMEESGCGEVELDPIACCCEFGEYENIEEFQADYSDDYETIEDIQEQTSVIPVGANGFIIVCF